MSSFTVRCENYHGRPVEVTWSDGMLTGDSSAVGAIASLAAEFQGHPIVTPAGSTHDDHLSNPYSAYYLMHVVLGSEADIVAGELPPILDPPEGGVD